MFSTHILAVALRDQEHLRVAGKHAGRMDHHTLLILRVEHLRGARQSKTSTSTPGRIRSFVAVPPGRCCMTDLLRVLAGGVVFIGQSQLRVEASAQQQLQQRLLA